MVCLNAAPHRPISGQLAALVDLLVVNAIEAEDYCGIAVTDLPSAATAAMALAGRFASVVVTAGGSGVAGIAPGEPLVSLPAQPVRVVSTHGAGDVFMGTLVADGPTVRGKPARCERGSCDSRVAACSRSA